MSTIAIDQTTGPISEEGHARIETEQIDAEGETQQQIEMTAPVTAMENVDPLRRRMHLPGRKGIVAKVLRALRMRLLPPPPSAEDMALMEESKRRKLLEKALTADARIGAQELISCLNRLGICHHTTDQGRYKVIRTVKFDEVLAEPDQISYHVARNLPIGVSIKQLTNPETLDNLGHSVGHVLQCRYTPEVGIWYMVERASGRAGIPNWADYKTLLEGMPASAGSLVLPIGRTNNARLVYEDLGRMIHVLIGGTTGSGKTNFLHVLICTLIQRNRPDNLRLVLVDLKGGLAFSRYEGLPHLYTDAKWNPTGIIEKRENVLGLLSWLIVEGERRMGILREAGAEDIGHYNARRKKRMPFIVVVIDEWADMMQIDKGKAEDALVNVVSRMRSVGIHVILATQSPTSRVITGLIKVNLPARFAFSVPNNHGSMAIIDDASAAGLQPVGRCVMQYVKQFQVQTPFLPVEFVERIVRQATTGQADVETARHDVTEREIMEWAIANNNGWLTRKALYTQYHERGMQQQEIEDLLISWEGKEFVINSSSYRVMPAEGARGRRLVAIQDTEEQHGTTN